MLKKLMVCLLILVTLCGCKNTNTRQLDEEKYNAYLANYQAILDYEDKKTESSHFNIQLVCNKLKDGNYRYDLIVDNPRVSMCDLMILMVEENLSLVIDTSKMMPSVGIFETESTNMLPNQSATEKGYVKGVNLSLISSESTLRVGVLVAYSNMEKTTTTREYFSLVASYEEAVEEETTEQQ